MKKFSLSTIIISVILLISLYISPGILAQSEPKQEINTAAPANIQPNPAPDSPHKIGDIEFIYVKPGKIGMGRTEVVAKNDELPAHEVSLDSFQISKCEITQTQYKNIMEQAVSYRFPVLS